MLHELTHSNLFEELATDDHAYGIEKYGVILKYAFNYPWWGEQDKLKEGNILALTPAHASENADTYAWFALLRLREKFCGIDIVSRAETWGCYNIPAQYRDFEFVVEGGKGFFQAAVSCVANACGGTRTAANANTKRQLDSGEVCCPVKSIRVRNECVACPIGKTADKAQVSCVAATASSGLPTSTRRISIATGTRKAASATAKPAGTWRASSAILKATATRTRSRATATATAPSKVRVTRKAGASAKSTARVVSSRAPARTRTVKKAARATAKATRQAI